MTAETKPPGLRRGKVNPNHAWRYIEVKSPIVLSLREKLRLLFGGALEVTSRVLLDGQGEHSRTITTQEVK